MNEFMEPGSGNNGIRLAAVSPHRNLTLATPLSPNSSLDDEVEDHKACCNRKSRK